MSNKKIAGVLSIILTFALCVIPNFSMKASASGAESYGVEFLKLDENFMFDVNKRVSIDLKLTNNTNQAVPVVMYVRVTDYSENSIWYISKEFTIGADTGMIKKLIPDNLQTGRYKIRAFVVFDNSYTADISRYFLINDKNVSDDSLGVCTHFEKSWKNYKYDNMELIKNGGTKWIRNDCTWGTVEYPKGTFRLPQNILQCIEYAEKKGLNILMPLTYSHIYYCEEPGCENGCKDESHWTNLPYTDNQIAAYAKYCGFMAEALKGRVNHFEIWNEADNVLFNNNANNEKGDGTVYAKVLKAAYEAIKKANHDAVVLGVSGAGAAQSVNYIEQVLRNGGGNYMDALSIHPYTWTEKPSDEKEHDFIWEMNEVTKILEKYSCADMPVWATETGYPLEGVSGETWTRSPETQAAYNIRTLVMTKADGRLSKLFHYEFKDTSDGAMGYINSSGDIKPSYYMTAVMNAKLYGTKFAERINVNTEPYTKTDGTLEIGDTFYNGGYGIYRFKSNEKNVFVVWAKGEKSYNLSLEHTAPKLSAQLNGSNLTVDIAEENKNRQITVYNAYGNKIDINDTKINRIPTYIVCDNYEEPQVNPTPEYSFGFDSDNSFKLNGTAAAADTPVAVYLVKKNNSLENAAYIDQTNADSEGHYSFSFKLPDDDAYMMYVFDGDKKNTELTGRSGIAVTIKKNGINVNSIGSVKANDVVNVRAEIINSTQKGNLFGAVYDDKGVLKSVSSATLAQDNSSVAAEVEMKALSDGDRMNIYLLDENIVPLTSKR